MVEVAFKELLVKANAYCLPRLIKLNASKADAEDAFMEAMYVFWEDEKAGKIKHRDNLSALIYVMAKNIWLMQKRKARRGQLQEYATDPADFKVIEGKTIGNDGAEDFDALIRSENEQVALEEKLKRELAFQHAFKQLSEQCRELLLKFIVEKVRLKELQEAMGFPSADAVKMAKYRCKRSLVGYFKEEKKRA